MRINIITVDLCGDIQLFLPLSLRLIVKELSLVSGAFSAELSSIEKITQEIVNAKENDVPKIHAGDR